MTRKKVRSLSNSFLVSMHADQETIDCYVVCIDASAVGLDALERFFKVCPADIGAAASTPTRDLIQLDVMVSGMDGCAGLMQ